MNSDRSIRRVGITVQNRIILNEQDREGISRPVHIFVNKSKETKGTIAFLFGGYKYERTNTIIVGTKDWSNKDKPLKPKECETIQGVN